MMSNILLIISVICFVIIFILAILTVIFVLQKEYKTTILLCNISEILIPIAVGLGIFAVIIK